RLAPGLLLLRAGLRRGLVQRALGRLLCRGLRLRRGLGGRFGPPCRRFGRGFAGCFRSGFLGFLLLLGLALLRLLLLLLDLFLLLGHQRRGLARLFLARRHFRRRNDR